MSNLPDPRSVGLLSQDNVLTLDDLWLRRFALGSMNTPTQLAALPAGRAASYAARVQPHCSRHERVPHRYRCAAVRPVHRAPRTVGGPPRCPRLHRSVGPAFRSSEVGREVARRRAEPRGEGVRLAKTVSSNLGHAGISITADRYSHVLPAVAREAAERVAALVDEFRC